MTTSPSSGVLHRDLLDAGLEWAPPGYDERRWEPGERAWAFPPTQGVAPEQRRWYRAEVLSHIDAYIKVRFLEGGETMPPSYRFIDSEQTLFCANVRDDLEGLN